MTHRLHRTAMFCVFAGLTASCTVAPEQIDVCDGDGAPIDVTGAISQGRTGIVPKTLPIEVKGKVYSSYLVKKVTVGGVPADGAASNFADWTVKLGDADLESNRDGDHAKIDVVAIDYCDEPHTVDTMNVPLWPAPGVTVQGLDLAVTLQPEGECSLPASGNSWANVVVTASAASLGGKVTLSATHGTFVGGAATIDLLLGADGKGTSAATTFIPSSSGTALLTASADGSLKRDHELIVTGAPQVQPTTTTAKAGQTYELQVTTSGNLEKCYAVAPQPGLVTFEATSPDFGVIDGDTPVKAETLDCTNLEILKVKVTFAASVPAGTEVSLHCTDTFGQDGSAKLTVAAP